ncbi:hypothetical protein K0E99_17600 [Bacteroides fragilis]|jgi:hypothetical protein|uniref:hypothetical protein n=1 Tax=Bacteroides TaxID=816 RepID=UPI0022AACC70|nr:hypothetical protein [Bacteroides fragilis]MCE8584882.1 hypothetical protein [Bacteroides fragilis]MCE8606022.1 hypothetical protein [Bacteroides fragilis]MCE8609982.1 hypothetical protein [Bacteroides fragilis]MCE8666078.1 hypothetical protein [Bacteroides fragilis]MCE8669224.1 hypothetical protein [Bacteroides fragilis]
MPIKNLTPEGAISDFIGQQVERITSALIYNLCAVGEQVLNQARSTNSYKDQTGNLRSSIGYVVAVDGEVVQSSSFEVVKDGADGSRDGKSYALDLVKQFPEGIVLIVVAGMNYASYVSAKGYDVLDSSEVLADRLVPEILKQLGFNFK